MPLDTSPKFAGFKGKKLLKDDYDLKIAKNKGPKPRKRPLPASDKLPMPLLGTHRGQFANLPPNTRGNEYCEHIIIDDLGLHSKIVQERTSFSPMHAKKMLRKGQKTGAKIKQRGLGQNLN